MSKQGYIIQYLISYDGLEHSDPRSGLKWNASFPLADAFGLPELSAFLHHSQHHLLRPRNIIHIQLHCCQLFIPDISRRILPLPRSIQTASKLAKKLLRLIL